MINIHTGKLQQLQQSSTASWKQSSRLITPLSRLQTVLGKTPEILRLQSLQQQLQQQLYQLQAFYHDSIRQYEHAEQSLLKQAAQLRSIAPSSDSEWQNHWYTKADIGKLSHRTHTTFGNGRTLIDYAKNGICAGIFAGFDAVRYQVGYDSKYAQLNGSLAVGSAHISGDVKTVLYEDKAWNPRLEFSVEAEAVAAQLKAGLHVGTSFISGDVEASVGVGVAKGEAKAVISKDEVTLKGEVGVAAVQGKVKGKLSLFGVDVTLTGTGELGAAGIGAEFSSKTGEVEFGGKASLLAGLGFKVKINY